MLTTLRGALCAALLAALPVQAWAAEEPMELTWEQLIPQEDRLRDTPEGATPWGIVEHGQMVPLPDAAEGAVALVTGYDGKRVRIPGFVVPLDFEAAEVREFLLVPYVGACIHVPPPPPNQIIYVQSPQAIPVDGMFEPVWVTGTLSAGALSTELADVGYRLTGDTVAPYVQP